MPVLFLSSSLFITLPEAQKYKLPTISLLFFSLCPRKAGRTQLLRGEGAPLKGWLGMGGPARVEREYYGHPGPMVNEVNNVWKRFFLQLDSSA